jgi:hypothetical protein
MNISEKLPGLKFPVLARDEVAEDERLLKLFWNRAELKKGLQALDGQLHTLRNRLKQQESANSRLQDQMERLEVLLGNPERGPEALVHFALRNLWRECRTQLEQFAEELRRQRQEHERKRQLAEFKQDRQERLKLAEHRLAEAGSGLAAEQARLEDGRRRLGRLSGFWNYLRRRGQEADVAAQLAKVAEAERQCADLREAHRTIDKEPWPEFPGLSVEGRRAVNLAVIALAQLLCMRLAGSRLARDARQATHRRVQDVRYGSREECLARLDDIAAAMTAVRSRARLAVEIRAGADRLRAAVSWRTPTDVMPSPASLPATGSGLEVGNVLIDDYWDVYKVLLR